MELIAPHLIVMALLWGNCALVLPYVTIFIHALFLEIFVSMKMPVEEVMRLWQVCAEQ